MKKEHLFGKVCSFFGHKDLGRIFDKIGHALFSVVFETKKAIPPFANLTVYHTENSHEELMRFVDSLIPVNGPLLGEHSKPLGRRLDDISLVILDHETKLPVTIGLEGVRIIRAGEWGVHSMFSLILFYENLVEHMVHTSSATIEDL